MPVVSILSASYCHGDEIARKVSEVLSYKYIGEQLLAETAQKQRLSKEKFLTGILESSTGFLKGASERIRCTAHFRAALAGLLNQDKIVYHGIATLLVPKEVSHVLRVCLVGDIEFRLSEAVRGDQISDREARSRIKRADTGLFNWAEYLHSRSPWDETLYDIVIPVHTLSVEEAVGLIAENARKEALVATPQSQKAVNDFITQFARNNTHGKPVVIAMNVFDPTPKAIAAGAQLRKDYAQAGVPAYTFQANAARAMARFIKYHEFQARSGDDAR